MRRRGRAARAVVCAIIAMSAVYAGGCGGGSAGTSAIPSFVPSTNADALFQQALQRMQGTRSLRFDTNVYENDKVVETRLDEQAAPDRAHRVDDNLKDGSKTESIIVGKVIRQKGTDGKWHGTTLDNEVGFDYPGVWAQEYATWSGFADGGSETIEGRAATLLRYWHEDAERGAGAFNEELVWIDQQTERILRWDVNKYQVKGTDRTLLQRWQSGVWQFDTDVSIALPE